MFETLVKDRLSRLYDNFKTKLINNPPRAVLYLFGLLGVGVTQLKEWLNTQGFEWFVGLHDWVDSLLEPIPWDVDPFTAVGIVIALLGADVAGRTVQRFTEPRQAYDAIMHKRLEEHLEDGEEEENA